MGIADQTVNPMHEDIVAFTRSLTQGRGADVVMGGGRWGEHVPNRVAGSQAEWDGLCNCTLRAAAEPAASGDVWQKLNL